MTQLLIVLSVLLAGALASAVLWRWPALASLVGSSLAALGSLLGLNVAVRSLSSGTQLETTCLDWPLPNASFCIGLDPLTSFFLVPLFLLGAITAVYGHRYLGGGASKRRRGLSWISFNLLVASMALLLVSRHALLFLVAWEVMSLSAYLLVTYDHELLEVRKAGMIYLVAAHIGVTCLIALFLLLERYAGGFEFAAIARMAPLNDRAASGVFVLTLLGFGVKAGLIPMHVWLPQAHAAAPCHVSALMSGVLIKMGIYGILRVVWLIGGPRAFWGAGLLCLGVLSAVFGISIAVYQRDFKRVLAYSSIENMGIVTLGLGLGFWGATRGFPIVAAFGTAGALLHVYHHSVMKGLLFLLSGNVLHACHTKDLERLGGLGKRLPISFGLLMIGAVAISGLPPLSAFTSEWLLYLGLAQGALVGRGAGGVACVFAVALLSLIGAVAVLSFVRLVSVSMLGEPRSAAAEKAREASIGMWLPLLPLAALILIQALFADRILLWIRPVAYQVLNPTAAQSLSHLGISTLVRFNLALLVLLLVALALAAMLWGRSRVGHVGPTWDCGYAAPTPRIQYGARGISELFTETLMLKPFAPKFEARLPDGVLPEPAVLASDSHDPLTRGVYEPFFTRWADRFARLRWMQQGQLHIYLLYILMTLLVALAFSVFYSGGMRP